MPLRSYYFLPFTVYFVLICFPLTITKAEGFSGADLAALLREAGLDVLRRLKSHDAEEGRVYD